MNGQLAQGPLGPEGLQPSAALVRGLYTTINRKSCHRRSDDVVGSGSRRNPPSTVGCTLMRLAHGEAVQRRQVDLLLEDCLCQTL